MIWYNYVLTGHIRIFTAAILDDIVLDTSGQTFRLDVTVRRIAVSVWIWQFCDLQIQHAKPPSFIQTKLGLFCTIAHVQKVKVLPYSLPSFGPGADPGVGLQAVSPQVTWSESRHRPGSSMSLLSARPAVTSVAFTRWRYLQENVANIIFSFNFWLSFQRLCRLLWGHWLIRATAATR